MICPGCGKNTISRIKVAFDGFGAWRHKCRGCGEIYKVRFSTNLMLLSTIGMLVFTFSAKRMYGLQGGIAALLLSFVAFLFIYARFSILAPVAEKSDRVIRIFLSALNSFIVAVSLLLAACMLLALISFQWPGKRGSFRDIIQNYLIAFDVQS